MVLMQQKVTDVIIININGYVMKTLHVKYFKI